MDNLLDLDTRVKSILYDISYKPFTSMCLKEDLQTEDFFCIRFSQLVFAVRKFPIIFSVVLDRFFLKKELRDKNFEDTKQFILSFVEKSIKELEEHEFKEYFRYKNKNIYEPH